MSESTSSDHDTSARAAAPAETWAAALAALTTAAAGHAKERAEAEVERKRFHERHQGDAAKRASIAAAARAKVEASVATWARKVTDDLEKARMQALSAQQDLRAKTAAESDKAARMLRRPGIDASLADTENTPPESRVRSSPGATGRRRLSLSPGEAIAASEAATQAHLGALNAVIEAARRVEEAAADARKAEKAADVARREVVTWPPLPSEAEVTSVLQQWARTTRFVSSDAFDTGIVSQWDASVARFTVRRVVETRTEHQESVPGKRAPTFPLSYTGNLDRVERPAPTTIADQTVELLKAGSVTSARCGGCAGTGTVPCPNCHGTSVRTCSSCAGSGNRVCPGCSGLHYGPHDDNRCNCPHHDARWGHTGPCRYQHAVEVQYHVDCGCNCHDCGCVDYRDDCRACGGSGAVACPSCSGTGTLACTGCNGKGTVACRPCDGTGSRTSFVRGVIKRSVTTEAGGGVPAGAPFARAAARSTWTTEVTPGHAAPAGLPAAAAAALTPMLARQPRELLRELSVDILPVVAVRYGEEGSHREAFLVGIDCRVVAPDLNRRRRRWLVLCVVAAILVLAVVLAVCGAFPGSG